MTYNNQEISEYDGAPVEFFLFDRNNREFWSYTSSDEEQVHEAIVYSPVSMKRGRIEKSMDVLRNNLTITMPIGTPFVQQFIASPPTDAITLKVFSRHVGDIDSEVVLIWVGRVINLNYKESIVDVRCEPLDTSFKRPTLRRVYGTTCPHGLYGIKCAVDKELFLLLATITAVDELALTAAEFATKPDGYFAGGFVDIEIKGNFNRRFVTSHVDDTIFINLPLSGAGVGSVINAFPGCTHNTDTCTSRFSNILNYGGQPFIPQKNPMGGTPIF